MIVHVLDLFRPRKDRELAKARRLRQQAYAKYADAADRQDTKAMSYAAADLRAATNAVLRLEIQS